VNDPGFRAVSFDQVKDSYKVAARALVDGGVDILLVETIFDTLNAKAALFAIDELFEETGTRLPIMISGRSPTPPAARSPARRRKRSGTRCATRARSRSASTARWAPSSCARTSRSSPASPTSTSPRTQRGPAQRDGRVRRAARGDGGVHPRVGQSGWLNITGGCCGTTPAHIKAISEMVSTFKPRTTPKVEPRLRLSGLEPLNVGEGSLFVNVGERTNVTGSKAFARLVLAGDYPQALSVARQQVESGAQVIDINMDEAMLDSAAAMTRFLQLVAAEPDIARVPIMIDSSKWSVIEAGPQVRAGQGDRETPSRSRPARRSSCTRRASPAATERPWS
jgi:5-methyltetrahydrofolate--homocysteine methyltransferase